MKGVKLTGAITPLRRGPVPHKRLQCRIYFGIGGLAAVSGWFFDMVKPFHHDRIGIWGRVCAHILDGRKKPA